jgi:XTP/dITP diphosphohydrolase
MLKIDRLLIATRNGGKTAEFKDMLGSALPGCVCVDLRDFPDIEEVAETGRTFYDNACLKAVGYARAVALRYPSLGPCYTLADDSGLEVDALGRSPGVQSARWAELHARGRGDADNNRLLLEQLRQTPEADRTARFVCTLALADAAGNVILTTSDTIEGRMLTEPRGHNGFGYDPLFFVPHLNRTTAELSPSEKHAVSHRGKALRRLSALIHRLAASNA